MLYLVCLKLNMLPQKTVVHIVQLDRTKVKFIGEMNSVLISLFLNPEVCQLIDILVADVLDLYDLIASRYWSEKLDGYFYVDWSHLRQQFNGNHNQIRNNMLGCVIFFPHS